jgi:hypothetical protein
MSFKSRVYNVLWGSSDIPDNHVYEILISNITYIILGGYMILTTTGSSHDEDRYIRAMILILVGFVSTIFHANQVTHGMEDDRTTSFHITDISIEIANREVAIVEEKNKKILDAENALKQARTKLLGDTFKMFTSLNNGFTKDEQKRESIRKAIAVGEIATDTALAISAAVKASSANPANAVTGGAAGAVQLAATLVKIGTNIGAAMAILRSGNPSGVPTGDGGMPSPSTSPQTTPTFNIRETQTQPQQQRVFVVEDDIRDMQDRVNGYNRVAIID